MSRFIVTSTSPSSARSAKTVANFLFHLRLIVDVGGYIVRDCKMSRRIDPFEHSEIVVQVQLYGKTHDLSPIEPESHYKVVQLIAERR